MLAYAYLPKDLAEGDTVEVETLDGTVTATIAADRLVDPDGLKLR